MRWHDDGKLEYAAMAYVRLMVVCSRTLTHKELIVRAAAFRVAWVLWLAPSFVWSGLSFPAWSERCGFKLAFSTAKDLLRKFILIHYCCLVRADRYTNIYQQHQYLQTLGCLP